MSVQFEALRDLIHIQPGQGIESPTTSGVSAAGSRCFLNVECLNMDVSADELHDCIKKLKRGKSAEVDGVLQR